MRDTGYQASSNNSGGMKSCQIGLTQRYKVVVTDPANANFGPEDVTDLHVAFAPGIPVVNYHTWYSAATGVGIPLAVCSGKTVKRSTKNATVFFVDCTFKTESNKQSGKTQESETPSTPEPEPPPEVPTDIAPVVTRAVIGRDIVLPAAQAYKADDQAYNAGNPVSTRYIPIDRATRNNASMPALDLKNQIGVPITRKQAMLQLNITQFEETVTDNDLLTRCFRANDAEWNGFPAKSAMITAMNSVEQSITVDDGSGGVEQAEWNRVTYTVLVDEYEVQNTSGSLFVGHAQAVPMVGSHHEDDDNLGTVIPFQKSKSGIGSMGLVGPIGEALADQDGSPDYVRFNTVDEADFSTIFPGI